ncbi:24-hydroxycholesterol 7-alpha-hydroxylase-like [Crassostrea angulata]|uniref:24-hydroxycholesterol 7-alpha-hydroxylase-like n=1 Tax=Magallana angulata TaxID=2784310 RepID=UPI0022B135E8|nr:24-hydroxycholesterol 7-alpha-hydroxylase-like [Crassostrea angulata]
MDVLSLSLGSTGLLTAVFVFLSVIYYIFSKKTQENNAPPSCKGWIPWLGCAFDFGVAPLGFIDKKRRELGPVFTLHVAGERLTFLTEAEDFHHFFQSSNVDFQRAVQDPVQNIASVSEESFMQYHTKIHDMMKGRLASSRLSDVTPHLIQQFKGKIQSIFGDEGEGDLHDLVRKTMYAGVINNLFGDNTLPVDDPKEFEKICQHFIVFDEQFEYGARLPPMFIRDWSTAKQYLLSKFRGVVPKLQNEKTQGNQTVLQSLVSITDKPHAPNYALMLLWAALANAVPITFWALSMILSNKRVLEKLQKQVDDTLGNTPEEKWEFNEEFFKKMPYLKSCVMEAIRLHSVGVITRRVMTSFTVREYVIPKGDMLMVSPFWSHRNPKYFPEPDTFNPDRWNTSDLEKNLYLEGFIAFGGGRYQCPGRWYALMELQMFIALLLFKYKVNALSDHVPSPSLKHVVGTQQPSKPFLISYKTKAS